MFAVLFFCRYLIDTYLATNFGDVAEWLGRGLQNLVHRFESGRRLKSPIRGFFYTP